MCAVNRAMTRVRRAERLPLLASGRSTEPLATVALHEVLVATDVLLDGRPEPHMTRRAVAVAHFGDRLAAAALEQLFVGRQRPGLHLEGLRRPRRGQPRDLGLECRALGGEPHPRLVTVACRLRERGLGRLQSLSQGVSHFHQGENAIFDLVFFGLGGRDLVEERGVFVVRLDRGLVVIESGQADVDAGDVFLERPPGGLILGQGRLFDIHDRCRLGDRAIDGLLGRRQFREPAPGGVGR